MELELVRSQDFAVSTSASSVSPKVRMETDNYHVYYGKLLTALTKTNI